MASELNNDKKAWSVLIVSTLAFTVCFMVWMMFGVIGIPIRQMLDQRQAIAPLELRIANRDVDHAAMAQGRQGRSQRRRRQHVIDTNGIEHLMQCHQLERIGFKYQDFKRAHKRPLKRQSRTLTAVVVTLGQPS